MTYDEILKALGEEYFGVLAATSTAESVVYARNNPTCIGDLFLIPCERRDRRVYVFRMTEYANVLRREDELDPMAKNLLAMNDPFPADVSDSDKLLRLTGYLLGYSEEQSPGEWIFRPPRKLPPISPRSIRLDLVRERPSSNRNPVWLPCCKGNWAMAFS